MISQSIDNKKFGIVKWDPAKVAIDMETQTSNGEYIFSNDECLTHSQIKSYFSRLAIKQRSPKTNIDGQDLLSTVFSSKTPMNQTHTDDMNVNLIDPTPLTDDDEDAIDDRELQVYAWRHIVDEAKNTIEHSSMNSGTLTSSTTNSSSSLM